jgi:hypothetical protein
MKGDLRASSASLTRCCAARQAACSPPRTLGLTPPPAADDVFTHCYAAVCSCRQLASSSSCQRLAISLRRLRRSRPDSHRVMGPMGQAGARQMDTATSHRDLRPPFRISSCRSRPPPPGARYPYFHYTRRPRLQIAVSSRCRRRDWKLQFQNATGAHRKPMHADCPCAGQDAVFPAGSQPAALSAILDRSQSNSLSASAPEGRGGASQAPFCKPRHHVYPQPCWIAGACGRFCLPG